MNKAWKLTQTLSKHFKEYNKLMENTTAPKAQSYLINKNADFRNLCSSATNENSTVVLQKFSQTPEVSPILLQSSQKVQYFHRICVTDYHKVSHYCKKHNFLTFFANNKRICIFIQRYSETLK